MHLPGQNRRTLLRTVLAAAAAAPLAGCGLFDRDPDPAPDPDPDPLEPLIAEALRLADQYDTTISHHPELADQLAPVAEAHRTHAEEIARTIGAALPSGTPRPSGTVATPGPAPDSVKAALAALRTAEKQGRESAALLCRDAPPERAALVGCIAAARATHLEVLK